MTRLKSWTGFSLLLLSACGIHRDKPAPNDLTRLQSGVTFRTVSDTVFKKYGCLNCHNSTGYAAAGVALDRYDLVHPNLGRIEKAVLIDKTMPPGGPLLLTEQALLRAWLDQGASEYGPDLTPANTSPTPSISPTPTPLPTLLQPHFKSIKSEILDRKCVVCHSVGGSVAKIPFNTYVDILNSPREIVLPKRPDESGMVIFTEAADSDPERMPPVKSGIPRITKEEASTIRQWILDGAKDD